MLSIKGLSKSFSKQIVLQDINLEVGPEIKALIGINGSGKSTLLKIVAGILAADSGSISIGSKEITSLPPEERNIGYVPQHPALFTHLSVQENIRYGMRHGKGTEEIYQQAVEMLDLKSVLDKKPGQLSGGYQHRASLARALVPQPEVMLLDEPLNGVDVVLKEKLLPEFRNVLKVLQIPVLFVTHDPGEARLLADNYFVIVNGEIASATSDIAAFQALM